MSRELLKKVKKIVDKYNDKCDNELLDKPFTFLCIDESKFSIAVNKNNLSEIESNEVMKIKGDMDYEIKKLFKEEGKYNIRVEHNKKKFF